MVSITAKNITVDYPILGHKPVAKSDKADTDLRRADIHQNKKSSFVRAVDNFSIEIKEGERLGIIGLNGSGKSTLLRTIGGIYKPTGGTLEVDGRVSSLLSMGLGPRVESTGRRNIYLRGYMRGLSKEQIAEVEPDIIEFSGLGEFIDMPLRTYSQGMGLRLSFAIMTAFKPEILLMDEWVGAGDSQFREKAAAKMQELVADAGITVVCSHNVGIIKENCGRVIWMDKGKIIREGEPHWIMKEYIEWRDALAKG